MSELIPVVDHAVINVDDHLDDAQALFVRMGFQLSARGHHSMGSSNHLAIFGENYLELLGYEPEAAGKTAAPKGLWQPPVGLVGLVWKTQDADAIYQHLQKCQLDGEPPTAFFRPVMLPDGHVVEARFCITRINSQRIPSGFSFFCQHLTPDAVWQPEWQQHPNGVQDLSSFVIVADAPDSAAQVYSQLFGPEHAMQQNGEEYCLQAGKTTLRIITPAQLQREGFALPADYNGQPRMCALELRVSSLARTRACLEKGDIRFSTSNGTMIVSLAGTLHVALRFHE